MTLNPKSILILIALICFVLKAFNVVVRNIDFMNLGFAFLTASLLVS
jgi:hypothetical protein